MGTIHGEQFGAAEAPLPVGMVEDGKGALGEEAFDAMLQHGDRAGRRLGRGVRGGGADAIDVQWVPITAGAVFARTEDGEVRADVRAVLRTGAMVVVGDGDEGEPALVVESGDIRG
jgi:hypothetical protein